MIWKKAAIWKLSSIRQRFEDREVPLILGDEKVKYMLSESSEKNKGEKL
jgi:hypothetical protein